MEPGFEPRSKSEGQVLPCWQAPFQSPPEPLSLLSLESQTPGAFYGLRVRSEPALWWPLPEVQYKDRHGLLEGVWPCGSHSGSSPPSPKRPKNDIREPVCLPSAFGDFLPSLGTQGE